MNLEEHHCPKCGKDTLETQSGVIWCGNLGRSGERPCMFGLLGEKTLDDLPKLETA